MKYFLLLLIFIIGCRSHKEAASITYTKKDSTKVEIKATERVVELAIREQNKTDRIVSSDDRRSSVVESKKDVKQAKEQTKQVVVVAKQKTKTDIAVAKVENRKEKQEARVDAKVEKKQIQSVIVAKKQLPNTVKWVAVLLVAIIFGWLVIKKKIPFLK